MKEVTARVPVRSLWCIKIDVLTQLAEGNWDEK